MVIGDKLCGKTIAGLFKYFRVDNDGHAQVDVLTNALATDAALASKQDTGNASLASVDGKLGNTAQIEIIPTVTASAYTASHCVGGKLTIANAVRATPGTGILQSLFLVDKSNTKPSLEVLIFNADPTAATITDHAAFVFSTDIGKLIRRISISASDWVTINSIAICDLSLGGRVLKAASGTSLYAVVVAGTSVPTFVSTSDLIVRFGILPD